MLSRSGNQGIPHSVELESKIDGSIVPVLESSDRCKRCPKISECWLKTLQWIFWFEDKKKRAYRLYTLSFITFA